MERDILLVIIESVVLIGLLVFNIYLLMTRKKWKEEIEKQLIQEREEVLQNALVNRRRTVE